MNMKKNVGVIHELPLHFLMLLYSSHLKTATYLLMYLRIQFVDYFIGFAEF